MSFLAQMKETKAREISERTQQLPLSKMKKKIKKAKHSFLKALQRGEKMRLIAEFKRASPSLGKINEHASLKNFVGLYERHADAISILTEGNYFLGSMKDIAEAKKHTKKPLLRKDFILDTYQIYEARYYGADAVLLIAGFVGKEKLIELVRAADELGMDALVECDSEQTLAMALESGSKIIGINNRDLDTMEEDASKTERLAAHIPRAIRKKIILVAESSIHSRKQIERLEGIADACLVGTSVMSSPAPQTKLKELSGKTLVKICGVTSTRDALAAVRLGADAIGLNFYEKSPRFVTVQKAREIAQAVRGKVLVVGVFVNEASEKVSRIANEAGLGVLQFSGNETPAYARSFGMPVIKAMHVKDSASIGKARNYDTDMIMLDAFSEGMYGGTGKRIGKGLVDEAELARKKIVFSGGLNASNVKSVIKQLRPFMVDVCSGTESEPGIKSLAKMKAFMKSAGGLE